MALSAEDKAEIAQLIAAATQNQAPAQQPAATQETTITPVIEATQQTLQQAAQQNPALAITADTLTEALGAALAKQTQTQESQLAKQLFDQQIDQLKASNPELGNYLDGSDEFGTPRMDRIKGIADYGERMKTLGNLAKNFNEAQIASTTGSQQPQVPKKIQEAADKQSKVYTDIDAKLEAGDITPEEHQQAFFDQLNNEVLDPMSTLQ